MITQTRQAQSLFLNSRGIGSSDFLDRVIMYPLRVTASITAGDVGQSVTLIIYGGQTVPPRIPLASMTLTPSENREAFTIYSNYEYIMATVTAFNLNANGTLTVQVNALEDI